MSEKQARTKGEYGQPFELEKQSEGPSRFVFLSPSVQNLKILLKRDTIYVLDGQKITTPLVEAQFRDFRFDTDSENIADMIRHTRAFRTGKIKELREAKAEARERQVKALQDQLRSNPDLAKEVLSGLNRPKATSSVAGLA